MFPGDSFLQTRLEDGKLLVALSDGMGSGEKAKKSSKVAIHMLEKLLTSGFDKDISIDLINSTIALNTNKETFATLDIGIFDLYTGKVEFVKNGACPTFIKANRKVDMIKAISLPTGILDKVDLIAYDRDLEENDIFVMCSDGILDANEEYANKELWVQEVLEDLETDHVQKIADILLKEAIDHNYGKPKDDMTVFVCRIVKKQ